MQSQKKQSGNAQSLDELVDLVFDGKFAAVHEPIRTVLGDALFDQHLSVKATAEVEDVDEIFLGAVFRRAFR